MDPGNWHFDAGHISPSVLESSEAVIKDIPRSVIDVYLDATQFVNAKPNAALRAVYVVDASGN